MAWKTPEPHDFHLLPLNRGPTEDESRAAHFVGHYAYRDPRSDAAFVLVKLQDLIVARSVNDPDRRVWEATAIRQAGVWGRGDGTHPVPTSLRGFYEHALPGGVEASKAPVDVIKSGGKPPRREFRPRPDCRPPHLHYDRGGPVLRLAIEVGPVDEVWRGFYIAFSSKHSEPGSSLAVGPTEVGAWKAAPVLATATRIGEWNRLTLATDVPSGSSVYLIGPRVPNLVVFGEPKGKQYRFSLDGGRTAPPPFPTEWSTDLTAL